MEASQATRAVAKDAPGSKQHEGVRQVGRGGPQRHMESVGQSVLAASAAPAPVAGRSGDDGGGSSGLPLVPLSTVAPDIVQDMRYATRHNFMGRPADGYGRGSQCMLSAPAAAALVRAQGELRKYGLGLKVFDCYRPQRAVNDFARWAQVPLDQTCKRSYYPMEDKAALFDRGYLAHRSGHSRGSTVDLTVVKLNSRGHAQPLPRRRPKLGDCRAPGTDWWGAELPMGTAFDCFDVGAHSEEAYATTGVAARDVSAATAKPASRAMVAIPAQDRANRLLLRTVMDRAGFESYDKEWWHFTLRGEPFPSSYFDVPLPAVTAGAPHAAPPP